MPLPLCSISTEQPAGKPLYQDSSPRWETNKQKMGNVSNVMCCLGIGQGTGLCFTWLELLVRLASESGSHWRQVSSTLELQFFEQMLEEAEDKRRFRRFLKPPTTDCEGLSLHEARRQRLRGLVVSSNATFPAKDYKAYKYTGKHGLTKRPKWNSRNWL